MPENIYFNGHKHCESCKINKSVHIRVYKCAECEQVHYCSRECQKNDWKQHKSKCFERSSHAP